MYWLDLVLGHYRLYLQSPYYVVHICVNTTQVEVLGQFLAIWDQPMPDLNLPHSVLIETYRSMNILY